VPASGLSCDDRPCFEYYSDPEGVDAATGRFRCELCIPVTAL
jgi:AraC family transcriptional regulator